VLCRSESGSALLRVEFAVIFDVLSSL